MAAIFERPAALFLALVTALPLAAQGDCVQQVLPSPNPVPPGEAGSFAAVLETNGAWIFAGEQTAEVDGGINVGRVHVYRWDGASWVTQAPLEHPMPFANERFGGALDSAGDLLVVGARARAWVYRLVNSAWELEDALPSSIATATQASVATDGQTVLLGRNSLLSTSVDVFVHGPGGWSFEQTLDAEPDPDHADLVPGSFGADARTLSVQGDRALVGAPDADLEGTTDAGAAYLYERTGSTWSQVDVATPLQVAQAGSFGSSVQVEGDRYWVGFPFINGFAIHEVQGGTVSAVDFVQAPFSFTSVGSREFDLDGPNLVTVGGFTGGVALLRWTRDLAATTGAGWTYDRAFLEPGPADSGAMRIVSFAGNVAVRGNLALQDVERSVWVLRLPTTTELDLGGGVAGQNGQVPSLGTTCAAVQLDFAFELGDGPANGFGALAISLGPTGGVALPNGGTLWPLVPGLALLPVALDANGDASVPVGLLPAGHFVAQCGFLDPAAAGGFSLSNGLGLVVETPFSL